MPSWRNQSTRGLDLQRFPIELADDPTPVLLDIGPADIWLHVERAHERGQDRSPHL